VLTSPGSRRQSRRCRSVHRPYAETSIRCSPVHGARAPTEHPNPTSSATVCRLWTLWPSRRASGTVEPQNTRTTAPVLANRMPSDQRKPLVPEHPPITHRLPAIPRGDRLRNCQRSVMPQTAELAYVIGVPRLPHQQPLHSVRQSVLSPVAHMPTRIGCPHQTTGSGARVSCLPLTTRWSAWTA
jgi:hypothetical protein